MGIVVTAVAVFLLLLGRHAEELDPFYLSVFAVPFETSAGRLALLCSASSQLSPGFLLILSPHSSYETPFCYPSAKQQDTSPSGPAHGCKEASSNKWIPFHTTGRLAY
jgi:hypothetical protein